jgi:formylglycine-generating enzyme required for sulfatase activity
MVLLLFCLSGSPPYWAGRRLPTEACCTKAARGTDGRKYPWGDEAPTDGLANFNSNVGDTTRQKWAEVGSYANGASPYGAFDMAGNVCPWVNDADFARPHAVGYNDFVGQGNIINNIREVYPDALVVEYHFDGIEPQYGGLDWRSLRLVLEEQDGVWYLVGIVHSEWTT